MRRARAIATGLAAGAIAAALIVFHSRLSADFWPPDRSFIGPNLVASVIQGVVVAIVATLLYPPLRKWMRREIDQLHAKVDAHHDEVLELMHRHHAEHMDLLDPKTPGGVADIIAAVHDDGSHDQKES